jgi:hypothetical protein
VSANYLDIEAREGDRHAQLVVAVAHDKASEARHPGALAGAGQTAGDADQVRLRDADVEETLWILLREVLRARRVVDVAVDDDQVGILLAELGQGKAEGFAGGFAGLHVALSCRKIGVRFAACSLANPLTPR